MPFQWSVQKCLLKNKASVFEYFGLLSLYNFLTYSPHGSCVNYSYSRLLIGLAPAGLITGIPILIYFSAYCPHFTIYHKYMQPLCQKYFVFVFSMER